MSENSKSSESGGKLRKYPVHMYLMNMKKNLLYNIENTHVRMHFASANVYIHKQKYVVDNARIKSHMLAALRVTSTCSSSEKKCAFNATE